MLKRGLLLILVLVRLWNSVGRYMLVISGMGQRRRRVNLMLLRMFTSFCHVLTFLFLCPLHFDCITQTCAYQWEIFGRIILQLYGIFISSYDLPFLAFTFSHARFNWKIPFASTISLQFPSSSLVITDDTQHVKGQIKGNEEEREILWLSR